jgi:hypothetical protein
VTDKYELIDDVAAGGEGFPISKMCSWIGVSASGFYEWRSRPESATAARRRRLATLVAAAFAAGRGSYGYRRVHAQLVRWGERVSPELVRAVMRQLGLVACQPRPYRRTTRADAAAAALVVSRTWWVGTSPPSPRAPGWSGTSPTFGPGKAGCTWRPCSTAIPSGWSAGRWPSTCAPS